MSLRRHHVLFRAPLWRHQSAFWCGPHSALSRSPPAVRPFNSSARKDAASAQTTQQRRPPQQSFRTYKDGESKVPNDLGFLEGTFVRPTGDNLPSLLSNPNLRWQVEKTWAWTKLKNFGSLMYFKFFMRIKPRPRLNRGSIRSIAREMYVQLYMALASGNDSKLDDICADGLLSSCRKRISTRASNEVIFWGMLSNKRPVIVSDRAAPIPVPDVPQDKPCALRQVVVRLQTEQYLYRTLRQTNSKTGHITYIDTSTSKPVDIVEKNGAQRPSELAAEEASKTVTEHIVLQKRTWMGKEEHWLVWGTVRENKAEALKKETKREELDDKIRAAKA